MTDDAGGGQASGYDAMAEDYLRYWAPVLRRSAEAVLEDLATGIAAIEANGRQARVLDVGSGTGTLALAAVGRWARLLVTGIDPSGGMLEVARRQADANLAVEDARRYTTVVASADQLPDELGPFDAAMSSFVLQLVPNRLAALREIRRVLLPGATFAWVAWLRTDRPYEPDRIANAVLDDFGFEPPEPDGRPGDIASPRAAAVAMRRAGFLDVRARTAELEHAWDAQGYLDFFTGFDEASLFAELEAGERGEIERRILEGLRGLDAAQLTLRLPLVYVTGRAPGPRA